MAVDMQRKHPNSPNGANLEPNHTHFLLVDNGKEGSSAWGGEVQFRFALERQYCLKRRVPRVLLCVQGGPGSLDSVYHAIDGGCPVVLVRDSGGVATVLAHFLQTYKDIKNEKFFEKGEVLRKYASFEKKRYIK